MTPTRHSSTLSTRDLLDHPNAKELLIDTMTLLVSHPRGGKNKVNRNTFEALKARGFLSRTELGYRLSDRALAFNGPDKALRQVIRDIRASPVNFLHRLSAKNLLDLADVIEAVVAPKSKAQVPDPSFTADPDAPDQRLFAWTSEPG